MHSHCLLQTPRIWMKSQLSLWMMLNPRFIAFYCSSCGKLSSLAGLVDQNTIIKHWCFLNYFTSLLTQVSPAVTGTEPRFSGPPLFLYDCLPQNLGKNIQSRSVPITQLMEWVCYSTLSMAGIANQHQWSCMWKPHVWLTGETEQGSCKYWRH